MPNNFLTLEQMLELTRTCNIAFIKHHCPFCTASIKLLDELKSNKIIDDYIVKILDEDYTNQDLDKLAKAYDWESDSGQAYPSKPQIWIKGEFIGGNFEFYKSEWNLDKNMPKLANPMRF